MAQKKRKASLADDTKGRVGILALVVSTVCLIFSVAFFLSKNGTAMGIDVGQNIDIWGWMLMLFSMFLAVTGLSLAVTMSNR